MRLVALGAVPSSVLRLCVLLSAGLPWATTAGAGAAASELPEGSPVAAHLGPEDSPEAHLGPELASCLSGLAREANGTTPACPLYSFNLRQTGSLHLPWEAQAATRQLLPLFRLLHELGARLPDADRDSLCRPRGDALHPFFFPSKNYFAPLLTQKEEGREGKKTQSEVYPVFALVLGLEDVVNAHKGSCGAKAATFLVLIARTLRQFGAQTAAAGTLRVAERLAKLKGRRGAELWPLELLAHSQTDLFAVMEASCYDAKFYLGVGVRVRGETC
eukprot:g16591.t1